MVARHRLAVILAALCCLSTTAVSARTVHSHVKLDGHKRSYQLHVPKCYDQDKAVPLVLVLHGAACNASMVSWDTRMSKQADRDGFIVAYPTGTAATWNAGDCCGPAYDAKVDDIAYLRALIQKIESQYNIDRDKIYIAGLSNGGMLAYRAGAELSDIVAAIAPVAGCMFPPKTGVKEPVSVICFNGTADKLVPIAGGGQCWFFSVHATPTAEAVDFWVHRDHCASDPICETTGHVMRQLYKGGSDGTEVCVYTLAGGGHHWPGGRTAGSIFGDKPSSEISATEVMCQFFWSHPKQHNENPG